MNLLPAEVAAQLPALYATDGQGDAVIVWARWFTPDSGWAWYAVEWDGADLCFGLVEGLEVELGYFSLAELAEARGPMGLAIERDQQWRPRALGDVRREIDDRRAGE